MLGQYKKSLTEKILPGLNFTGLLRNLLSGLRPPKVATATEGGERGIRTPGPLTVNGFQDRRNRPLCHLSGGKSTKPG